MGEHVAFAMIGFDLAAVSRKIKNSRSAPTFFMKGISSSDDLKDC